MADKAKKVGVVTHYYTGIGVAIVKASTGIKAGDTLQFKGSTTDFKQAASEMQFDHKAVKAVKKGQEVGIKVDEKVREGDQVFLVK